MVKYIIYYKEEKIGTLYIDEHGKYKYLANNQNIEKAEREQNILIIADLKKDRDWGNPIPFFEARINNCKRFSITDKIEYPNSGYYFIKDNH